MARIRKLRHLRRRIQYAAIHALVRTMIVVSHGMSRRAWLWSCGRLGSTTYYLAPRMRALTVHHLALAFPERSSADIRRLARKNFVMLAKNAGEIFRATRLRTLAEMN
jgi:lauroyl/myristoyl acyltransferase